MHAADIRSPGSLGVERRPGAKILVIAAAFPPDSAGEADHALHLCKRLNDLGFDIDVLTKAGKRGADHGFCMHSAMLDWGWKDLPRFARFLKDCAPDAVLLLYTPRDYNHNDMMIFAPSIAKAVLPKARFVTQLETALIGPQGSRLFRAVRRGMAACVGAQKLDYVFGTLLSGSDHVITLSERHLQQLAAEFPGIASKASVIPPPPLLRMCSADAGVARERGRALLGVPPESFLLAYYGYVYEEKGVDTLIRALPLVRGAQPVSLVMIGGNPGQDHGPAYVEGLKAMARASGVSERILWTGEYAAESEEASLYLHAADAGVFPFRYGVTLNRSSIAAAASHGLPIVTTRGAELEDAFVARQNVLLCPPGDPAALAQAIQSLLDEPELRRRLSAGSRELARRYFSWERALEQTVEALRG